MDDDVEQARKLWTGKPRPVPAPGEYKSIRLDSEGRGLCKIMARETLYTPDEEAAEAAAHKVVFDALAAIVNAFSAVEMAVLEKYGHTRQYRGATVHPSKGDGRYSIDERFTLDPSEDFARRSVSKYGDWFRFGLRNPRIQPQRFWTGDDDEGANVHLSGPTAYGTSHPQDGLIDLAVAAPAHLDDLVGPWRAWARAKKATDDARKAVLGPLFKVIDGASRLQAVADVWPDAMRLAPALRGIPTSAVAIDEVKARIAGATFGNAPKLPTKKSSRRAKPIDLVPAPPDAMPEGS